MYGSNKNSLRLYEILVKEYWTMFVRRIQFMIKKYFGKCLYPTIYGLVIMVISDLKGLSLLTLAARE